ncbi:MAG TPA: hypothetical protein VN808_01760 [Stellaceae bacterium]|nr:hypothetical protein [Stellaceae bacterium]
MSQIYRRAAGAALFALTLAPVAALAEDASATPPQGLVSFLPAPSGPSQPADTAGSSPGVSVASLPSDAMVPSPPLPTDRGFYISADGSGQSVSLPTVNLGFVNTTNGLTTPPFLENGSTTSHNPTATGVGVDLAFGYFLPPGTVSPALGSAPRVELDFNLVDADQRQSTFLVPPVDSGAGVVAVMLNGTVINNGPVCNITGISLSCPTNSTESTDFMTWHLAAKVASDFPLGGLMTATPSLSVIGGEGHNNIAVSQTQTQISLGAPGIQQTYSARTKLNWDDVGGKAGLTLKAPLSSWVTASISGSVALVDRDTSLRGSDMYTGTFPGGIPLPIPPQTSPMFSAVSSSKNTMAVLSNVEGSLSFQACQNVSVRFFGGMNYDDSVPGVRAPVFFGSVLGQTGGTPARIKFVGETSFYGGAGLVIHF